MLKFVEFGNHESIKIAIIHEIDKDASPWKKDSQKSTYIRKQVQKSVEFSLNNRDIWIYFKRNTKYDALSSSAKIISF